MSKVFVKFLACLLLGACFFVARPTHAVEYCGPGTDYPDLPLECFYNDEYWDEEYFWCCPEDQVCNFDYESETWCLEETPTGTTVPATSTTISGGGPTTTQLSTSTTSVSQFCADDPGGPIECLDLQNQPYWCCPEDYPVCGEDDNYGMCLQGDAGATTTVPSSGGTGDGFIVGININGEDSSLTESSGTLPGTSPSVLAAPIYREDGRLIPLWYERQFAPLDPALVEKTKKFQKEKNRLFPAQADNVYEIGEQHSFWVKDDQDRRWRTILATNRNTGEHGYIFVDDELSISDATLELYAAEFEIMYSVLSNNIGQFSDRDGNGKITILLYDINDGGSINMYMGGYFWSKDYLEDSDARPFMRSNEMDILYIRGNVPSGWEQAGVDFYNYNLTTLVHEYQHLVHFGIKVWDQDGSGANSDVWIDEMMAMSSETMYFKEKLQINPAYTHPTMQGDGYLASRIAYYNSDTENSIRNGHGLTYWDSNGDVLSNYALSYLFGQYLAVQSAGSQDIFKAVLDYMIANGVHDYRAVAGAASLKIPQISSWEDLLKSFAVANIANRPTGLFGYNQAFTLTAHGPILNKVNIHNGGAVYRMAEENASAPPDAGPDIKFFDSSGNPLSGGTTNTTTIPAQGPCPAALILGENSEESNLLRDFRDEILSATQIGRDMLGLYYQYAPELTAIIINDDAIKAEVAVLLLSFIPHIKALLNGESFNIGSDLEEDMAGLLEKIFQAASPGLQEKMKNFKMPGSAAIISTRVLQ